MLHPTSGTGSVHCAAVVNCSGGLKDAHHWFVSTFAVPRVFRRKAVPILTAVAVSLGSAGGLLASNLSAAGASSGPFTSTVVTVHQTPDVICRANGGTLSPNAEADQMLGFSTTYPQDVHQGDTFNIKIKPDPLLVPRTGGDR